MGYEVKPRDLQHGLKYDLEIHVKKMVRKRYHLIYMKMWNGMEHDLSTIKGK
jgi:hypothetical protein